MDVGDVQVGQLGSRIVRHILRAFALGGPASGEEKELIKGSKPCLRGYISAGVRTNGATLCISRITCTAICDHA